jgi:penicillin-binding protein 2
VLGPPQARLHVLALACLAVLLVLVGRLWMLQFTQWGDFVRQAAGNRTSVTYTPAPRGLIFDRKNVVLAENRPVWNVSIVPAKFPTREEEAEKVVVRLAGILRVPTPQLRPKLEAASRQTGRESVALDDELGADLSFKMVAQIEEQALPGVIITESSVRTYPHGELAAHVLGYARSITEEQLSESKGLEYPDFQAQSATPTATDLPRDPLYSPESVYGQAGLESRYEINRNTAPAMPILSGRKGRTVYEVDAALTPVRLIEYRLPMVGASLHLSLDAGAQQVAEDSLRQALAGHPNRTGSAVVMDVEDGSIIVMASRPAFDPNDWVGRMPAKRWQRLSQDPRKPMLNKATAGGYPPASTFKLVSMSAALDLAKATPQTRYYCPGQITEGPRRFKCWKPGGHGTLDFRQGLANSCDVYFYELVRKAGLSVSDLDEYARMFGLGEKTRIDLPEEIAGLVPNEAWKQNSYGGERWWTGDSINMVIGQGWTTVTPLQMARVCAAVANGGFLLRPHLVDRIDWPEHFGFSGPTVLTRVVDRVLPVRPETLQVIREGMRLAVVHGTAEALKGLPVAVAGKTGSAEHLSNRPPHAWFVCFAPYEKPKYAVAVFVAEGGHGGATAAPIARSILASLFGLKSSTVGAPVLSD